MSLNSPKNSNSEEDYYKPYSEEVFEVESILESRLNPRLNKQEYLVKWKRWPDENTWEPTANLRSYAKMIVEFEENKKRSKQMAKSAQMSKKLKSEPEVKNSQISKINKSEVVEKEISARLRSQQQQQQSKDKRGSSFNSFFEEEDGDEDGNNSDFDEDYVPYNNGDKHSQKHNLSDSMKSNSMVNEDEENLVDDGDAEIEEEQDYDEEEDEFGAQKLSKKKTNNVDEQLFRLKREFAMKYSMPSEQKSSVEDASTNSSQELTQKTSLQLGAEENKPKATRRLAKRSKPTPQESELGGFLIDDISEITATITYEYTINLKHQPNLAVQPEAQQVSFTKVHQISPDQFISELSEHYVHDYKKD